MNEFIAALTFVAAIFIPLAVVSYVVATYNDLARRLERLKAIMADTRRVQRRGRAVRGTVSKHVRTATGHEQSAIRHASKRRGRGGQFLNVQDNANGWPQHAAIGTTERGLSADIEAHDREQLAWQQLHAEAHQYNALLRTLPSSIVARAFGFRPWRLNGNRGRVVQGKRKPYRSQRGS